jgi:hypothetical protein
MGVPAEQSTGAVGQRLKPAGLVGVRSPRRRRPTGAPPLLPYHVATTGVGWLAASVVLVALTIVVFARGTQGLAVSVTATDDTIVRWLTELHAPGLTAFLQGLAGVGSWVTITLVWAGLVVALLVLRRFRHLIVVVVSSELVIALATVGIERILCDISFSANRFFSLLFAKTSTLPSSFPR